MALRVLIVDDDPLVRSGVDFFLKSTTHDVIAVGSRFEAAHMARRGRPHIALVDIHLSGLWDDRAGVELAWELQHALGIPTLFLTGDRRAAEEAAGSAMGFLLKPVTASALLACLDALEALLSGDGGRPVPKELTLFRPWGNRLCPPPVGGIVVRESEDLWPILQDDASRRGLSRLLDHWHQRRDGAVWKADAPDLRELSDLAGHVNVLERHDNGDYRFRVFAAALADHVGTDMSRQLLDTGPNLHWARSCHDHLTSVTLTGRAEYRCDLISGSRGVSLHHRLAIPMSSDGLVIDRWVVAVYPV